MSPASRSSPTQHLGAAAGGGRRASCWRSSTRRSPRTLSPGDFIVAGLDFAGDATHRTVPAALKALGVAALIARSFGHFFLRNAINVGLPALVVEETAAIKTGDRLRVDVEAHVVANLSSGDRYVVRNLDDEAIAILRAGGIVERHGSSSRATRARSAAVE